MGQGPARKPQRRRRPGEDWGEAEPLTLNRSGRRSSGGVLGFKAEGRPLHPCHVANAGCGAAPHGVQMVKSIFKPATNNTATNRFRMIGAGNRLLPYCAPIQPPRMAAGAHATTSAGRWDTAE